MKLSRQNQIPKHFHEVVLFILIFSAAFFLRFYKFNELPFTNDELSAVFRAQFSSFSELIQRGVIGDEHPAGVQVFLFYWIKWFGNDEPVVRLPFLILGSLSVVLFYFLARKWFNTTVALIASAFLATLQFPITESQLARPYAFGMFFSLLLVWCWSNFLFGTKNRNWNLTGFILSAAACAYIHYFSALFAFVVAVSGIFFLKRNNYKSYIAGCLLSILLFLPHWKIFEAQLSMGGLDWLAKPRLNFLLLFFKYCLHYSLTVYLLTATIILIGVRFWLKYDRQFYKFQILCLAWFALSVSIGFFYAINYKPVMHFQVLIFSFPFLLLFLISFFPVRKFLFSAVIVFIVLITNIYTLIADRKHFEVMSRQPYSSFAGMIISILENHSESEVLITTEMNGYYNYYIQQSDVKAEITRIDEMNYKEFRTLMEGSDASYFISGNMEREYLLTAKEFYPNTIDCDKGFTYEHYILSKQPETKSQCEKIYFDTIITFQDQTNIVFEAELNRIANSRNDFIDIELHSEFIDSAAGTVMKLDIVRDNIIIDQISRNVSDFSNTAYLAYRINSACGSEKDFNKTSVRFYLQNAKQTNLNDLVIRVSEGNPWVYGLYYDMK